MDIRYLVRTSGIQVPRTRKLVTRNLSRKNLRIRHRRPWAQRQRRDPGNTSPPRRFLEVTYALRTALHLTSVRSQDPGGLDLLAWENPRRPLQTISTPETRQANISPAMMHACRSPRNFPGRRRENRLFDQLRSQTQVLGTRSRGEHHVHQAKDIKTTGQMWDRLDRLPFQTETPREPMAMEIMSSLLGHRLTEKGPNPQGTVAKINEAIEDPVLEDPEEPSVATRDQTTDRTVQAGGPPAKGIIQIEHGVLTIPTPTVIRATELLLHSSEEVVAVKRPERKLPAKKTSRRKSKN